MEKITLKPQIRELLFKNGEPGVHFDVLSCQGATTQEKNLGTLLVISQLKFTDEDLSYLVSLIFSLAKREYYSQNSLKLQDPKAAFSKVLGKLNEVLEEFFQNKDFKLNIGLAAISGNNIYISRLGKFKISLARDGQFIDILNNVDLFNKDTESEKQFSNIISGQLRTNDKLFAYYPARGITSREKQLNGIFAEADQENFSQKIAQLASDTKSFSCCGVHVQMEETKEIPVRIASIYPASIPAKLGTLSGASNESDEKEDEEPEEEEDDEKVTDDDNAADGQESEEFYRHKEKSPSPNSTDNTRHTTVSSSSSLIIPAELSVVKRTSPLSQFTTQFSKLKNLGRLNPKARARAFVVIAAMIIVPIFTILGIKALGTPAQVKEMINATKENLRLAESYLNQNNTKEARSVLNQSLAAITATNNNEEAEAVYEQVKQALASIDRANENQPELFLDLSTSSSQIDGTVLGAASNNPYLLGSDNRLFSVSHDGIQEIGKLDFTPKYVLDTSAAVVAYNGTDQIWSFDLATKKSSAFTLKEPGETTDAVIYEGNLYTLSAGMIYKYADTVTGGTSKTSWNSDAATEELFSISIDGNIFALSSNGKLLTYFKGKKTAELDLQFSPTANSRIHTFKNSPFIYLSDKTVGKVYVFDKTTGDLKTSYNFSLADTIDSMSISQDGTIWALSADNKIWMIK